MIMDPEILGFVISKYMRVKYFTYPSSIFKERTDDIMSKTRKLTMTGMFCTISYLVMIFCRVPVVLFLKYDPKDVIVTMGGFFLGPLAAFFISVAVSFMEMFSVSDTGLIGFIMNMVSTCSFACTASLIYRKVHNFKGVFAGLLCGSILMVTVMLLWNYYLVPLYMGTKGNICRTAGDGIPAF